MKDHLVPQQLIRRFANEDGVLWELLKPELVIGTRAKRAKGILFKEDWYRDSIANFDDELKRIEQRFARFYPDFADKPWTSRVWPGDAGAALICWIAAMACRTTLTIDMAKAVAQSQDSLASCGFDRAPQVMSNIVRTQQYERNLDLISRPEFKWKCIRIASGINFVLTDNPVFITRVVRGKAVWIAPLSRERLLVGGHADAVGLWRGVHVRAMNAIMAAWADTRIYAADKPTLRMLIQDLNGASGLLPIEFRAIANKPSNGMMDHIIATDAPSADEVKEWWSGLSADFGPSIVKR